MAVIVRGAERYPCNGPVTIGRGNACAIQLVMTSSDSEHYIGRLHARIEDAIFTDLSEHGSYVNGVHVFGRSVPLQDGDRIRIGDVDLVFTTV